MTMRNTHPIRSLRRMGELGQFASDNWFVVAPVHSSGKRPASTRAAFCKLSDRDGCA